MHLLWSSRSCVARVPVNTAVLPCTSRLVPAAEQLHHRGHDSQGPWRSRSCGFLHREPAADGGSRRLTDENNKPRRGAPGWYTPIPGHPRRAGGPPHFESSPPPRPKIRADIICGPLHQRISSLTPDTPRAAPSTWHRSYHRGLC
ncbi:unnamed protein product [Lota lota]